jgi:hypothetical protein
MSKEQEPPEEEHESTGLPDLPEGLGALLGKDEPGSVWWLDLELFWVSVTSLRKEMDLHIFLSVLLFLFALSCMPIIMGFAILASLWIGMRRAATFVVRSSHAFVLSGSSQKAWEEIIQHRELTSDTLTLFETPVAAWSGVTGDISYSLFQARHFDRHFTYIVLQDVPEIVRLHLLLSHPTCHENEPLLPFVHLSNRPVEYMPPFVWSSELEIYVPGLWLPYAGEYKDSLLSLTENWRETFSFDLAVLQEWNWRFIKENGKTCLLLEKEGFLADSRFFLTQIDQVFSWFEALDEAWMVETLKRAFFCETILEAYFAEYAEDWDHDYHGSKYGSSVCSPHPFLWTLMLHWFDSPVVWEALAWEEGKAYEDRNEARIHTLIWFARVNWKHRPKDVHRVLVWMQHATCPVVRLIGSILDTNSAFSVLESQFSAFLSDGVHIHGKIFHAMEAVVERCTLPARLSRWEDLLARLLHYHVEQFDRVRRTEDAHSAYVSIWVSLRILSMLSSPDKFAHRPIPQEVEAVVGGILLLKPLRVDASHGVLGDRRSLQLDALSLLKERGTERIIPLLEQCRKSMDTSELRYRAKQVALHIERKQWEARAGTGALSLSPEGAEEGRLSVAKADGLDQLDGSDV